MEPLAEAVALGRKAGLEMPRLIVALELTPVVSPGQKAKLENARRASTRPRSALRMMLKDFGLISRLADSCGMPMPAAAGAQ